MSRFTQRLIVEPYSEYVYQNGGTPSRRDERAWLLLTTDFGYEVGEEGSGDLIEVPFGFRTDLASVPRFLWFFIAPMGLHGRAAVIHDRLYETGERPRREADSIFLEAMEVAGTPRRRARLMWLAVRPFGIWTWLKHRRNDRKGTQ